MSGIAIRFLFLWINYIHIAAPQCFCVKIVCISALMFHGMKYAHTTVKIDKTYEWNCNCVIAIRFLLKFIGVLNTFSFILQISGMNSIGDNICQVIGVALHYFFLCSFVIMTHIAGDILIIFSNLCSSWYSRVERKNNIFICWILSGI